MEKEYLLSCIDTLLEDENKSIIYSADDIAEIREKLDKLLTREENYDLTSRIKNVIQEEANMALRMNGKKGMIIAATGVGKSKIVIDKMNRALDFVEFPKFMVVVPTQKLRDEGWKDEVMKWGVEGLWDKIVPICYDSLSEVVGYEFNMVVFDECHNFTENHVKFLKNNKIDKIVSLTATYPHNKVRAKLITRHLGEIVYNIDTDTSVKLGLVSPYDIIIVNVPLNKTDKDSKAGTKDRVFYTTEAKNNEYLNTKCDEMPSKFNFLKRMRFIYNLKSKEKAAKWILENIIPQDTRTLIFAGSKDQASNLCEFTYYSKPSKPKEMKEIGGNADKKIKSILEYNKKLQKYQGTASLDLFIEGKITRIACVEALNEGHNVGNPDCGLIVQVNSNELNLVQRIGRCIRYRAGYKGKIIIVCANETIDKAWTKKATINLNMDIREVDIRDLILGKETIKF